MAADPDKVDRVDVTNLTQFVMAHSGDAELGARRMPLRAAAAAWRRARRGARLDPLRAVCVSQR